jgi:preprotein translocase subunit YajC
VESLGGLILPIGLLAVMYFLLIRPQQKRMREAKELQQSIGPGDTVVTTAGIYGTVTEIEDDETMLLEIAEGIDVRVARAAVLRKVAGGPSPAADTTSGDDADEPEAPTS